jgi:HK97 family phage major capsid protein
LATGPNAVNPSGADGGGILRPEQARRFIDYVWDGTVLAKDGRRVTMRANTMELEKVNVGERVIRAAAQAVGDYKNTGATFSKVELTTKKIRLDWEVTAEALEDNIEGAALEDHLVRLMTNAFANDIEDLAINGDGTTGNFLSIMQGFINKVETNGDAHEYCCDCSRRQLDSRGYAGSYSCYAT